MNDHTSFRSTWHALETLVWNIWKHKASVSLQSETQINDTWGPVNAMCNKHTYLTMFERSWMKLFVDVYCWCHILCGQCKCFSHQRCVKKLKMFLYSVFEITVILSCHFCFSSKVSQRLARWRIRDLGSKQWRQCRVLADVFRSCSLLYSLIRCIRSVRSKLNEQPQTAVSRARTHQSWVVPAVRKHQWF